jgi:hypothetical protein
MPASGNGDNAVWVGSTTAGLRLLVKGDDPLWQAGVPFDSRATPEPPTSWSVLPAPFALLFSKNAFLEFVCPEPVLANHRSFCRHLKFQNRGPIRCCLQVQQWLRWRGGGPLRDSSRLLGPAHACPWRDDVVCVVASRDPRATFQSDRSLQREVGTAWRSRWELHAIQVGRSHSDQHAPGIGKTSAAFFAPVHREKPKWFLPRQAGDKRRKS